MKFIRYQYKNQPPRYGWIFEDRVGPVEGEPFGEFRRLEVETPLSDVRLLPPVHPWKDHLRGKKLR